VDAHLSAPHKLWAAWPCDPCDCKGTKRFFFKASKSENRRQKMKRPKKVVLGISDFETSLKTLMSYSMSTKASTILLIAILILVLLVIVQTM
jgi:hypothetical protein